MRLYILFLMSLLILSSHSTAQVQKMYFNHLSKNQGLPSNNVTSILQDSDGFMWFGTFEGLAKYDGYTMQQFLFNGKSNGLSDNQINAITEDVQDFLWIGTQHGLNRLNLGTLQFDTTWKIKNSALLKETIYSLFLDNTKKLWVGTIKGLFYYDVKNQIFIQKKEIGNKTIRAICQDKNGNLWLASAEGIFFLNLTTNQVRHYFKGEFRNIMVDSKGAVWASDYEGMNLYYSASTENVSFTKQEGFPNYNFAQIIEDKEGNYWLGLRDGGVFFRERNSNKWINLRYDKCSPNGINSNVLQAIYNDKHGNIWFGFFDMGVDLFDKHRKAFVVVRDNFKPDGLLNNKVRAMYQDSDGEIWIGTKIGGTLAKFNPVDYTFIHYQHDPNDPASISDDYIFCITEAKKGFLWIGTYLGGLNLFNKKTGKCLVYKHDPNNENSLSVNSIYGLFKNDDGKLWITSIKGVDVFDPEKNSFKHYQHSAAANSISSDDTRIVLKDKQGTIWIATFDGLNRYNPKTDDFTSYINDYRNPHSISHSTIYSMYEDKKGNFWVGTKHGLNLMNRKKGTFISYTDKEGLPSNSIVGIVDDEHGNLWVSTINGLSKFNPVSKTCRNYSVEDGLQNNEFVLYSYLKTKEGELFFGGNYGFNRFFPDKIADNPVVPNVVLTNFYLFNKPVEVGENSILKKHISHTSVVTLKYNQSVIAFEFAALSYTSPEKNQYAYKMEGFDKDWQYVGSLHTANYTNLDDGEYTFRVKASNNDKVWNETGTSIKLIILPPWWRTLWFRFFAITLIIGSAISFYRIRVATLHRQKQILEKRVKERTLELQESNILLEERQEEILQQNEEIISQKTELEKTYHSLRILSDFGQKITAQLSLQSINGMIYRYVQSLMDTSAFGIGIYNLQRNEIEFPSFMENEQVLPFFTKKIEDEKSLTAWTIRNKSIVFINNLDNEYKKYVLEINQHKASKQPQSLIHIPLIAEDRIIGIIVLNSFKRNAYREKDLDTLKTLASYISIALDNSNAYNIVKSQHEKITQSINYAQTIQHALLPTPKMQDLDYFVIYKPRDVVSGDFYWYTKIEELNTYLIAVIDCTGHGVPGAFMSLIGNLILNEVVLQRKIYDSAQILTEINTSLKIVLNQEATKNDDGMDICLCSVQNTDTEDVNVIFAGAKRRLFYFDTTENKIKIVKGDIKGIGGFRYDHLAFKNHELLLKKGDILYLSTDGFTDQNDKNRKEFGTVRFTNLLNDIALLPTCEQQAKLETALSHYQENQEQRDDITVLGIRL